MSADNTFRYALDDGEGICLSAYSIGWTDNMAVVSNQDKPVWMGYSDFEERYGIAQSLLTIGQCFPIGPPIQKGDRHAPK